MGSVARRRRRALKLVGSRVRGRDGSKRVADPLPSSSHRVQGVLQAFIWHNTLHAAVVLTPAADLGAVKVFPNPVNFASAVRRTIKFMGLSANPTIAIYDLAGERVITIAPGTASGATVNNGTRGTAEWDGRNVSGNQVARGTYIYIVTDAAGHKKAGKIGVIR